MMCTPQNVISDWGGGREGGGGLEGGGGWSGGEGGGRGGGGGGEVITYIWTSPGAMLGYINPFLRLHA